MIEDIGRNGLLLFVHWGVLISSLVIAYAVLWKIALIHNLGFIIAIIVSIPLLKASACHIISFTVISIPEY